MHKPIIDLGFTAAGLKDYLVRSGYWSTSDKMQRHAFTLSPCAYVLSERQRAELKTLSQAACAAVRRLEAGLCNLALKKKTTHEESQFLRMARSAAHGLLLPGQGSSRRVPDLIKIDLVANAREDYFQAVEIDVDNSRALGTTVLVDGMLSLVKHEPAYPIARNLSVLMSSRTVSGEGNAWTIVVSESERYYQTSYEIVAEALRAEGLAARTVGDDDQEAGPLLFSDKSASHIFAIPANMDRHPEIREALMKRFLEGDAQFFYPPKAYLGSKAFLPYIAMQEGMNSFIPPTALLLGNFGTILFSRPPEGNRMILKPVNSSGSRGLLHSEDNPESYWKALKEGGWSKTPQWVVQELVPQEPVAITTFDNAGKRIILPYYLRIILYATATGVAGIKVTGRPDQIVHGAPDCVQLPVL